MGKKIRQASFQPVLGSFHSSLNFNWWNLLVFLGLCQGGCSTLRPSGGEQGVRTNWPDIAQQLSALLRKASLTFLWSHSSHWAFPTGCMLAQTYWFCKDFPQESVSNALWMNLVARVVNCNIFSSESSAFHHENLLPNAESLGGIKPWGADSAQHHKASSSARDAQWEHL